MTEKVSEVLAEIRGLTPAELREMARQWEQEFGLPGPIPQTAEAQTDEDSASSELEISSTGAYVVVLTDIGPDKIPVIVEIRRIIGVGLREAKGLVELVQYGHRDQIIVGNLDFETAKRIQARFLDLRASITVKPGTSFESPFMEESYLGYLEEAEIYKEEKGYALRL